MREKERIKKRCEKLIKKFNEELTKRYEKSKYTITYKRINNKLDNSINKIYTSKIQFNVEQAEKIINNHLDEFECKKL